MLWSTFTHHIIHIIGWVGTVSSKMDWERLPVALLYADVRAYCSHVKMYCKRARLLSSHPLLFIIHSFKVKYSQAWVDTVDSETVEPQFTDSSLLRKVFFFSGEALTVSLNSIRWRIPVNAENAYLLLAQSTDSHPRLIAVNLANADTLLSKICWKFIGRPFLFWR